MSRLAIYIIGIAALLLVFLGRAADFIRFYLKPALAVGAKAVWVARGVMPCRPAGNGWVLDNFGAPEKLGSHNDENSKVSRGKGKKNDKRIVEDAMTQAEIIFDDAENDKIEESLDSGVFYLSWLKVLVSYGDVGYFVVGMIAIMCNLFFGTDVGEWGLPRHMEAVLKSFVPVIEANKKRRKNGLKGAEHGYKGGRPKTSCELPEENPTGVLSGPPNVTDKGKVYDNENLSVSMSEEESGDERADVPVTVRGWKTSEGIKKKIYYAVLAVFFFRNVCCPEKQTEKFLRYYCTNELAMKGKKDAEVVRDWVQGANRWEVQDDQSTRFEQQDIDFWARLYDVAPEHIRPLMLGSSIQFKLEETTALIVCPKEGTDWIEDNVERTRKILIHWRGNRSLTYKHLEDPK